MTWLESRLNRGFAVALPILLYRFIRKAFITSLNMASPVANRRVVLSHASLSNSRKRSKEWLLTAITSLPAKRSTGQSARPFALVSDCDVPILRERNRAPLNVFELEHRLVKKRMLCHANLLSDHPN